MFARPLLSHIEIILHFPLFKPWHEKLSGASKNALTMSLKTKKVPDYLFWKLQSGAKVGNKIREKERKTRDAPRSKPQKKEESVFEEVGADTKNSKRRA